MEEVRKQFTKDTISFCGEWYKSTAENFVVTNPDKTKSLGLEKLKEMKAKVQELVQNSGTITNELLSDPNLWWHLSEFDDPFYFVYDEFGSKQKLLDRAVRLAFGKLGTILEEFEYGVTTSTYTSTDKAIWVEYDMTGNYRLPQGRPYYPYSIVWSTEMKSTIQRYNELYKKANGIHREILNLQRQKKSEEAKRLWDAS